VGMIGHIRQITPDELRKLRRNPRQVKRLLHGKRRANSGKVVAALQRVHELGMQAIASGATSNPEGRERIRTQILRELESAGVRVPRDGPDEEGLRLEKSWHSLHYLLTGSAGAAAPPLGNAVLGGTPIGGDLGYGPARVLDSEQVREVASALAGLSMDDLARRFDLRAMSAAKVYACDDEDELELAQHYFEHLVRYYADAAARGNAMLLYIA
jgi:hypothetical protein